jgi:hypothetical protein
MNILLIISLICFALCLIIFIYLKWYINKRTSVMGLSDEHRAEVSRLINDINSVTDRNLQLIEDSIAKLKDILDDTDKRIAVYVKELDKSRTSEVLYTSLGRGIRNALSTTTVPQATPVEPVKPAEQAPPPASQLTLDIPPVQLSPPPALAEPPVQKPISKRQIRTYIDNLINEGHTAQEIASRLEISVAEVNLAMSLRR